MNRFSGSGLLQKTLATLITAAAFLSWTVQPLIGEVPANRLRGDYQRLKHNFEEQIKTTSDPKAASCLSVETAAVSWLLAAANLAANREDSQKWLSKVAEFEKNKGDSKNWDSRHITALEFYYESMTEIIPLLSVKAGQPFMLSELEEIMDKTEEQFAALEGKPDVVPEKRVVISGALVGLMSVIVRAVGGGSMEQPVQGIMSNVVTKADHISKRPDIHYRAKLSLLYANNIQGLTALVFLLGQNAGPPLSAELAVVHGTLNQYGSDLSLPDIMSMTWVAQAQASLPLAYWLATTY